MASPTDAADRPEVSPELLERWRTIGLSLDRQGRIWHHGEMVTHGGLHTALLRWIDRRDDGRYVVRIDEVRYAYIDVEDAPLRVASIVQRGTALIASLDDGTSEPLDLSSLVAPDGAQIYVRVRGGRLWARLLSAASQSIAAFLQTHNQRIGVAIGAEFWPIAETPAPR